MLDKKVVNKNTSPKQKTVSLKDIFRIILEIFGGNKKHHPNHKQQQQQQQRNIFIDKPGNPERFQIPGDFDQMWIRFLSLIALVGGACASDNAANKHQQLSSIYPSFLSSLTDNKGFRKFTAFAVKKFQSTIVIWLL